MNHLFLKFCPFSLWIFYGYFSTTTSVKHSAMPVLFNELLLRCSGLTLLPLENLSLRMSILSVSIIAWETAICCFCVLFQAEYRTHVT